MKHVIVSALCVLAIGMGVLVEGQSSAAADVQLQFADILFTEGRYADARDAYRRVVSDDVRLSTRAGAGLVLSLLRTGDFHGALDAASSLDRSHPSNATIAAVRGDALWSMGRFEEAEAAYDAALAIDPHQPRARH